MSSRRSFSIYDDDSANETCPTKAVKSRFTPLQAMKGAICVIRIQKNLDASIKRLLRDNTNDEDLAEQILSHTSKGGSKILEVRQVIEEVTSDLPFVYSRTNPTTITLQNERGIYIIIATLTIDQDITEIRVYVGSGRGKKGIMLRATSHTNPSYRLKILGQKYPGRVYDFLQLPSCKATVYCLAQWPASSEGIKSPDSALILLAEACFISLLDVASRNEARPMLENAGLLPTNPNYIGLNVLSAFSSWCSFDRLRKEKRLPLLQSTNEDDDILCVGREFLLDGQPKLKSSKVNWSVFQQHLASYNEDSEDEYEEDLETMEDDIVALEREEKGIRQSCKAVAEMDEEDQEMPLILRGLTLVERAFSDKQNGSAMTKSKEWHALIRPNGSKRKIGLGNFIKFYGVKLRIPTEYGSVYDDVILRVYLMKPGQDQEDQRLFGGRYVLKISSVDRDEDKYFLYSVPVRRVDAKKSQSNMRDQLTALLKELEGFGKMGHEENWHSDDYNEGIWQWMN